MPVPRKRRRSWRSSRWSYCRGLTNRIISIAVTETKPRGVPRLVWRVRLVSSRKRWLTFGNPGSDHHRSQKTADAVDFRRTNDYRLRDTIMRRLGVDGPIQDYGAYYVNHRGLTFRVQPIAQTHGSGPHLHLGVRRA